LEAGCECIRTIDAIEIFGACRKIIRQKVYPPVGSQLRLSGSDKTAQTGKRADGRNGSRNIGRLQIVAQHKLSSRDRLQCIQEAAVGRKFVAGRQPRQCPRVGQLACECIELQQIRTGGKLRYHQKSVGRSFDAAARCPQRTIRIYQRYPRRRDAVHPQSVSSLMDQQPIVAPVGVSNSTQPLVAGRDHALVGQHHPTQSGIEPHINRKIRQAPATGLSGHDGRRSPYVPLDLIHSEDIINRILARRLDNHRRLFGRKTPTLHTLHIIHEPVEPVPDTAAILTAECRFATTTIGVKKQLAIGIAVCCGTFCRKDLAAIYLHRLATVKIHSAPVPEMPDIGLFLGGSKEVAQGEKQEEVRYFFHDTNNLIG